MTAFSAIKDRGRRALHGTMGRPAYYYESNLGDPQLVHARYHSAAAKVGDLAGTNLSYAETHDRSEAVILLWEEVPSPKRNALVIFAEDEGYQVKTVQPRDGITIKCEVIRASAQQLAGKLSPYGIAPIP